MARKRKPPSDIPRSSKRQNLRPRRKEAKPELTPSKLSDIGSKQSLQQVKDEIRSLIKYNSASPRNFSAIVVLANAELLHFPLIKIENYGILPTLLTKPNFDDVKNHLLTSSDGASDSVATTNKNSLELLSDKFELNNTVFSDQVCHLFNEKVKSELELGNEANVFGKLLKLVINGPGGRIEDYKSINNNDDLSFATVIIQLPSFFTGGNIVVSHIEKRVVYTVSETSNNPSCSLVAYYSNCSVQQEEVTSGYQTLLIYSLCWDGNGTKPAAYNEAPNVAKFRDALERLMFREPDVCPNKDYFVYDRKILDFFKKTLKLDEQRHGKTRYHLYVANATKTVHMEGVCGSKEEFVDYEYGSDNPNHCASFDDDDPHDCGGNFQVPFSEYVLECFEPLTEATLKSKYLEICDGDAKMFKDCVIDDNKDEESFWGLCIGYDCTGPGGSNNVANKTQYYKRDVLVLWRADSAFEIKYNAGRRKANDGIYHILQLIKNGQLEEADNKLETVLWPRIIWHDVPLPRYASHDLFNVCCKLNKLDKLIMLFKKFPGTILFYISCSGTHKLNYKFRKLVGKILRKFQSSDAMINEFIKIIKSCKRRHVKEILALCNDTQVFEPIKIVEILINFVFKDSEDKWHGCSPDGIDVLQLFEYMILTNTYPDQEVNAAMKFIVNGDSAFVIINKLVTKECTPIFDKIILRYVDLLVQKYSKNEPYECDEWVFTNAASMIKCLLKHQKKGSIDVLLAKLLPTFDTVKKMLSMIEIHKDINGEDRMVIKTLAARLTELVVA